MLNVKEVINEDEYKKKLNISLCAYKRMKKEIVYYHKELEKLNNPESRSSLKKHSEFFSELEDTIEHCEKQKIMFLKRLEDIFYLITDLDNDKLNNSSEYKETQIIINEEAYA
jgi:hypothetical protein